MNVILLGAPGAGKGTIAQYLVSQKSFTQISTGDALREEVKRGSELGKKVEPIMKSGALVSDDLIAEVLKSKLNAVPAHSSVVFDGYPRTLKQADLLEEIFKSSKRKMDLIVEVKTDDEVIVQRLSSRSQCRACNAVYGLQKKPAVSGKCDACGGEIFQRQDDMPETIRKRLQTYREQTLPLINYYKHKHVPYHEIDGNKPIDAVYKQMDEILEKVH